MYTITYHYLYNGVEGEEPATSTSLPLNYSKHSSIELSNISAENYAFGGWYEDEDLTAAITTISSGSTGNKDLYASFVNEIVLSASATDTSEAMINKHSPVKSLSTALQALPSTSISWKVVVNGEVTEKQKTPDSLALTDGNTVTIEGKEGSSLGEFETYCNITLKNISTGAIILGGSPTITLENVAVTGDVSVPANASLKIGGSTTISGAVTLNKITSEQSSKVTVTSSLTADTVATITPAEYTNNTSVLAVENGISMADVYTKFSITPQEESTIAWSINSEGKLSRPYGTKSKPNAIGDIVFSDGSATAYSSNLTLTDDEKANAVAIIFYVGGNSAIGNKILGVGLQQDEKQWAATDSTGVSTYFSEIKADTTTKNAGETGIAGAFSYNWTGSSSTGTNDVEKTDYITGDFDGSDNWAKICEQDTSASTTPSNYPAFEWVNNYGNSLTGDFSTNWYLPTLAELRKIYENKSTLNAALTKVGGTTLSNSNDYYYSSNQGSETNKAWYISFNNGLASEYSSTSSKTMNNFVRAIRVFE